VEEFKQGIGDAWTNVATFIPKLIGFLLILVIGYFIAKVLARVLNSILERVGFDRAVERGGIKRALEKSKYDASDMLAKIVFYVGMLFVLQLAFGVFGPNPISDLIKGVIAYLPNVFVAIIIVVVGAAIAAAVKEIVEASLGGLSYGRTLALAAGSAVLVLAAFAALDQLEIAPTIVNGLFLAMLAIIVGSSVVAIGGGGIRTMARYWDRASQRLEQEGSTMRATAQGSKDRIQNMAEERREQLSTSPGATTAP
jgi:Conserved TM helix